MTRPPSVRNLSEEEEDPTGVRSLLSSLPDPGPLPSDVVQRIEASLHAAAAADAAGRASQPANCIWSVGDARVGRASTLTIAALAAGVLVIAGAGVFGLRQLQASDPAVAPLAISQQNSARAVASGPGALVTDPWTTAASTRMESIFTATDTRYAEARLASQASRVWATPGPTLSVRATEQPEIGLLGTRTGLASCLKALGSEPVGRVVLDFGLYEGRPAAMLILNTPGAVRAYVVGRSCRAGAPDLRAGPIELSVSATQGFAPPTLG